MQQEIIPKMNPECIHSEWEGTNDCDEFESFGLQVKNIDKDIPDDVFNLFTSSMLKI